MFGSALPDHLGCGGFMVCGLMVSHISFYVHQRILVLKKEENFFLILSEQISTQDIRVSNPCYASCCKFDKAAGLHVLLLCNITSIWIINNFISRQFCPYKDIFHTWHFPAAFLLASARNWRYTAWPTLPQKKTLWNSLFYLWVIFKFNTNTGLLLCNNKFFLVGVFFLRNIVLYDGKKKQNLCLQPLNHSDLSANGSTWAGFGCWDAEASYEKNFEGGELNFCCVNISCRFSFAARRWYIEKAFHCHGRLGGGITKQWGKSQNLTFQIMHSEKLVIFFF